MAWVHGICGGRKLGGGRHVRRKRRFEGVRAGRRAIWVWMADVQGSLAWGGKAGSGVWRPGRKDFILIFN